MNRFEAEQPHECSIKCMALHTVWSWNNTTHQVQIADYELFEGINTADYPHTDTSAFMYLTGSGYITLEGTTITLEPLKGLDVIRAMECPKGNQ